MDIQTDPRSPAPRPQQPSGNGRELTSMPVVAEVEVGPRAMERLGQAMLNEPTCAGILLTAIESAGGEIRDGVTWRFRVIATRHEGP